MIKSTTAFEVLVIFGLVAIGATFAVDFVSSGVENVTAGIVHDLSTIKVGK